MKTIKENENLLFERIKQDIQTKGVVDIVSILS